MSRIFKSNYVKIGTPKHIKSNTPPVVAKKEEKPVIEETPGLSAEEQADNIIEDAKEMYLKIVEEANAEAQRILDYAQNEKEAIHANAYEEGYREGLNNGYSDGMSQAENMIQEAADIKNSLDERSNQMYRAAELELMTMVLDIAQKVIGEELKLNPEVVISLIKQALAKTAFKSKLAIRVAEQDYEYVNNNKDRIVMLTEGINDLEICCDKALPKGSCIVETESGEINAGVSVQMNELQRAFENLMRNE